MGVKLLASSNGSVELVPANTASNFTVTVPAATTTMVGTDATQTLTNKTSTTFGVGNATPSASGAGITFPAALNASSDANTLDDYEEGSWTPSALTGTNLTGISWSAGNYTRVGRLVTLIGYANCTVTSSNTLTYLTMNGAPFSTSIATSGSAFLNNNVKSGTAQIASNIAYAFFPAASAPVAGAEIIQFSITYTVA